MLKPRLCDYSDVYIPLKRTMTIVPASAPAANPDNNNDKNLIFKSCAPFTDCLIEINNKQTDNAKDIDVVIPM